MIGVLERITGQQAAPAKKTRQRRKPPRDADFRARRRQLHHGRIASAATPAERIKKAAEYLADSLRFVRDQEAAWRVADQVSKVIVRAADGLDQHVRRGGRR